MATILDAAVALITDESTQQVVRNQYHQQGPEQQSELDELYSRYVSQEIGATIPGVSKVYGRTVAVSGTLAALDANHVAHIWATPGRCQRKTRMQELRLLSRMHAMILEADGKTPEDAKKVSEALILPPHASMVAEVRPEDRRKQTATRLTGQQIREIQASLADLFKESMRFLTFVALMIALLVENGGRFEGLQFMRVKNLKWRRKNGERSPIRIVPEDGGEKEKPSIAWRTQLCSRLLLRYLEDYVDLENQEALLFEDPVLLEGPVRHGTMDDIWGRIGRSHTISGLGPRAWRRYVTTTRSSLGMNKSRNQRNMGQVVGSSTTSRYIVYDDDHLVNISNILGFTQGLEQDTCRDCHRAVRATSTRCSNCKAQLHDSQDPEEARLEKWLKVGRQLMVTA